MEMVNEKIEARATMMRSQKGTSLVIRSFDKVHE